MAPSSLHRTPPENIVGGLIAFGALACSIISFIGFLAWLANANKEH